jgi:hypothetical protein
MKQDFKITKEEKVRQEVYVTNQSIIKITEDVIFMNRYKSNMWGGQYSTYSGILIGLEVFYFFILFIYYTSSLEGGGSFVSSMLFLLLIIIPIFILQQIAWRRELPICFNKKTQKVSAWIGGELTEIEWERFHMFHTKIQDGAQATAKVFLFTLFGKSGKRYPMTIWDELPAGLYAYVHDFMNHKEPIIVENGKMEIARGNFQFTFKELFIQRFTFRKEENIFMRIFLVFSAIFFTLPIDFLMYGLNKVLPRRKIPKELLDACGCEEGEGVYG